jgi:hypothetical protein
MGRKGPRDKARRAAALTVTARRARARLRRWLVVPAALAAACAPALLGAVPAQASAGCNVHYWWTPFNSPWSWVDAVITQGGPVSCTSAPAIGRFDGGTDIAGVSPDHSMYWVFSNTDGSPSWVKGFDRSILDGIDEAPSLAPRDGGLELAYMSGNGVYGNDLFFDLFDDGSPRGFPNRVTASGTLGPWAPGMAVLDGTVTLIVATGIDYSLWIYANDSSPGPSWKSEQIAGTWKAADAPSITAEPGTTEVSAIAPDGSLWFYWMIDRFNTWYPEEVAGPGSATAGQSMTHSDGAIQIAAAAPDGSLWFYWAADGTSTWHAERVAGPGSVSGTPSMTGAASAMEIAATGADGSLRFYWAADGTSTWYPVLLSGPGTTFASPAMTASGSTFEIASLTQ